MVMDTELIVDRGHRAGREVTQPQLVTVDGSLNRERECIFFFQVSRRLCCPCIPGTARCLAHGVELVNKSDPVRYHFQGKEE